MSIRYFLLARILERCSIFTGLYKMRLDWSDHSSLCSGWPCSSNRFNVNLFDWSEPICSSSRERDQEVALI